MDFLEISELYHHGIKGQKWGVRNGPPYPLGYDDHSSAEKKSNLKSKLDNYMEKREKSRQVREKVVDAVKSIGDPNYRRKKFEEELKKRREKKLPPAIDKNQNKSKPVPPGAKSMLSKYGSYEVGGGALSDFAVNVGPILVTAAATIGVSALLSKAAKDSFIRRDKKNLVSLYEDRDINSMKDVKKLPSKQPITESVKKVNPDYPKSGYTMNCTYCTAALAMREKGYSVKASASPKGHNSETLFSMMFKGSKENKCKLNKLQDTLGQFEDGAYGNLSITWALGGGHSVFWKKENGKINIYDGQSGKKHKLADLQASAINRAQFSRLDNCEPTDYILGIIEND